MEKKKIKVWEKILIAIVIMALISFGAFVSYKLYLNISDPK